MYLYKLVQQVQQVEKCLHKEGRCELDKHMAVWQKETQTCTSYARWETGFWFCNIELGRWYPLHFDWPL